MGRVKRIFITGSSGFIGKNLVEKLSSNNKVLAPNHKELDLLNFIKVEDYFKKNSIDIVIHTAVVGGSRKEEHKSDSFQKNMRMFLNIVRNKKYFKKFINLGSGAEYDKNKPLIKVKENNFDTHVPTDDYGFYKYCCSKYIENKEKFINLRIFGLFGKFERYDLRFISNAICKYIFKIPITINQNVNFDYVYIDDFTKIVRYFVENNTNEKFFNIGTGKKIDLLTIARKINNLSSYKVKITVKNSGLNKEYSCNNSRMLKEIKDLQFTDFDIALKELYNWYIINKKSVKKSLILKS